MIKNDTPTKNSDKGKLAEMFLTKYCERTFLKLWNYPNPYKKQGKELCDVLAVFEEHVFIFSIKDISFTKAETTEIAWERWKRTAIDESISQVKGAEKWIRNNPEKIFLDAQCTEKLPIPIDTKNWKFHRIVVAFGADEACKNDSKHNINGSLSIGYVDLNDSKEPTATLVPFCLTLPQKDFIHVFDSHNLEIILGELDTVRDLLLYFEEKERAIKNNNCLFYCGEENLLAHYLYNFDEKNNKNYIGTNDENVGVISIGQGLWEDFIKDDSYQIRKEENKISYVWDGLVQELSRYALSNELAGADVFTEKTAITEMANELRYIRRVFSEAITYALKNYSADANQKLRTRHFAVDDIDRGYVFLQTPPLPDENYEEHYRHRRRLMLEIACGVIKNKCPHLKNIIGISREPFERGQGCSYDLILLKCEEWTEKDVNKYENANKQEGFNFFDGAELKVIKKTD